MKTSIKSTLDRFEAMKAARNPWEARWREIARYVAPTRDDFQTGAASMGRPPEEPKLFDATAGIAAESLASGIYGLMTNPASPWFSLSTQHADLEQDAQVRAWFREVEAAIRHALSAGGNRFYSQVPDFFRDLAAFGTGVFYVDQRRNRQTGAWEGLNFFARPLSEVFVDQDANGEVDTVYRRFTLTARQVRQSWPQAELPKIDKALEQGQGDQAISLLHAVEPNLDYQPNKAGAAGKAFTSRYINLQDDSLIAAGGYQELPYQVARWTVSRGSLYGASQAMLALPDIRTINAMAKTSLLAAQKSVDPPILVPNEVGMQGLKIHPGAVIVGGLDASGRRMYEPITLGSDVKISLEMENQRRGAIKEAFHASLLMMMDAPKMTATEFLGRQDENMRLLAPYLGRVQNEFLDPLLRRVYALLARAGQIPTPPPAIASRPGFKISYQSPLARAQRTTEANAIMRSYQALAPLAESAPQVMQHFDIDKAARSVAEAFGVPDGVLKSADEVASSREQQQGAQHAPTP